MKPEQEVSVPSLAGLYDEDFFEWTRRNAELLRAGELADGDIAHKRQSQPEKRPRSWERTIINQRIGLETLLEQSPSLWPRSRDYIESNYEKAVYLAAFETRMQRDKFPGKCPFSLSQILDREFLP